jgi:hypothetical protein
MPSLLMGRVVVRKQMQAVAEAGFYPGVSMQALTYNGACFRP